MQIELCVRLCLGLFATVMRYLLIFASLIFLNACKSELAVVDGYANKTSYLPGEKCELYLSANDEGKKKLSIYDLRGNAVYSWTDKIFAQEITNDEPWKDGFGYEITSSIQIPELESGIYLIENLIPIVIKSSVEKPITIVYPSNTINAYCSQGGKSLYSSNSTNKEEAKIVSFLRPLPFGDVHGSPLFYEWFDTTFSGQVNFICDYDLDDAETFSKSDLIVIPGHNEYWSRLARRNFDRFINHGGNALILSGNTMWWQVRYDSLHNQLICYKDKNLDPIEADSLKNIHWDSKTLDYSIISSIGADFTHGGYGMKKDDGWNGFKIMNETSPLLAETNLKNGEILELETYEYDGAPIVGLDQNGNPILDSTLFFRQELIAYDRGSRFDVTYGTFFVFQKTENSGVIVHTGSTDWCSTDALSRPNAPVIFKITTNAINLILNGESVFSEKPQGN